MKRFPDDERGKAVLLTKAGKQLVERVERKLQHCLDEQLGRLQQDDPKTYFTLTNYIARTYGIRALPSLQRLLRS
jgi:DNA-binding MarR family transcriptional regulator